MYINESGVKVAITLPAGKTFMTQLPAQITTNGTVTINEKSLTVTGDENGVIVTTDNGGAITSITNVNGSVTYDGTTYKRVGDKIFSGTQDYEVTDNTNILSLTDGTNFVMVENKVIDLSEVSETTIFVDEEFAQVAEFQESVLTVSGEGYGIKIGDGFNGTIPNTINVELPTGDFTLNGTNYNYDGKLLTYSTKVFDSELDNVTAALIATTSENWKTKVDIIDTIDITDIDENILYFKDGAKVAELKDGKLTINDGDYKFKTADAVTIGINSFKFEDDADGVTVTIEDNAVKSVSGINDGGTVKFDGTTYKRVGNEVSKTFGDTTTLHSVTDTTNLLKLTGDGLTYEKLVGDTITLNGKNIIYGTEETYSADKTIVSVTYGEGSYSITKGAAFTNQALTFQVNDENSVVKTNFETKINATVEQVKVNGIGYTSANNDLLTISTTADSSSLYNGAIIVTDKQEGVEITGGNVSVTATNSAISSITGLDNGETVTYGGKTYERVGNKLFSDGKIYDVDDATDILNLTGGASYVEVNDTIDIIGITELVIFIKNSA